jgi:ketosteroid isomerase-like protein
MTKQTPRAVVEALWQAFDTFDFDAAGKLLHDEFVCEWPQSRERVRGRKNFVALNTHYPGQWRVAIIQVVCEGDHVVTETLLRHAGQTARAISFFTVRNGKITHLREFWPDPYPAPEWRDRWIEKM